MPRLLLSGDMIAFDQTVGAATLVTPALAEVEGSAHATADGRALCHAEDVTRVEAEVAYVTAACPVPGRGILRPQALAPDQVARVCASEGAAVVLAAGRLACVLEVRTPATAPPPAGTPDPVPTHLGGAQFQLRGPAPSAE